MAQQRPTAGEILPNSRNNDDTRTMNRRKEIVLILLLAALWSIPFLITADAQTSSLNEREARGKRIYTSGLGAAGVEITASLGNGVETPASVLPCSSCHGRDGKGRPEGGVTPSDITWSVLTKPYAVTATSGRRRQPYNDQSLRIAIAMGVDPNGNQLQTTMPKYRLSHQDMADLIAYIKKLGGVTDPGLTENRVRIGAVLAPAGPLSESGQAVKAVLTAYFTELNGQGGVNGRAIEPVFVEPPESSKEREQAVKSFVENESVFALTASFIAGADKEIAGLAQSLEVPVVGAFTLYPQLNSPLNRYVFYLYAGLAGQCESLVGFASKNLKPVQSKAAIVFPDDAASREVAEAAKKQFEDAGWKHLEFVALPATRTAAGVVAARLRREACDVVLSLAPAVFESALFKEAAGGWSPMVLIPGSLANSETFAAPATLEGRLFLSYPTLPSDQVPDVLAEYRRLAEQHRLTSRHSSMQLSALASAKLLVEALKRRGRDLSREGLVETLEGFYEVNTGLTPPVSFGPNTRVGATKSHIVSVDLKKRTLAKVDFRP